MSWMKRMVTRGRVRTARRTLGQTPTVRNYCALANEHARLGELDEVLRVCDEGLGMFPETSELLRLAERARQLQREDRIRELYRELREAPRPALWKELCEILIEAGRVDRAEEVAGEWHQKTQDGMALNFRARARVERFLCDRHRDDGRLALEFLDAAERAMPRQPDPLRLRLQLVTRIGAWNEAHRIASRLLEILPGDPVLEARFRTLSNLRESSPSVEEALREVEKTGRLIDDEEHKESTGAPQEGSVRPLLKELASDDDVQAAVYVRGGTALVQGPKGATADRAARAMREMVQSSRTAARRLGLGAAVEVRLEGDFGSLLVAPSDHSAAALWCNGPILPWQEQALLDLSGMRPRAAESLS